MPKVGSGDEASYADPDEFHDIRDSGTEDGWADFDTDNGWPSREDVTGAQETPVQDGAGDVTTTAPAPEVPAPEVPGDETVTEAPKDESALMDAVPVVTPPSQEPMEVRPTEEDAARPKEDAVSADKSALGDGPALDELAAPLSAVSLDDERAEAPVELVESIEGAGPAELAESAEVAEPAEPTNQAEAAETTAPHRPTKAAGRFRPAASAEVAEAAVVAEAASAASAASATPAVSAASAAELGEPVSASAAAEAEETALRTEPTDATLSASPPLSTEPSADPLADTTVGADDTLAAAPASELSGAAAPPADDDFDDFGDFAEQDDDFAAPADTPAMSAPSSASASVHESAPASASASVASLPPAAAAQPSVDVHAPPDAIRATVAELLPDFVDAAVPSSAEADLTREPLREIEGLAQVLTSDASRALFRELQTPVPIASTPLDWTRSATRRRHLISLGIPVNLDEVQQPAASRPVLPPLELHVEPVGSGAAAAGGPAASSASPAASTASPAEGAAPAEGWGARRRRELGSEPPAVPMERVEELVAIGEDQLTLKALPELRALAREMRTLSKQLSDLLAHHLMVREAFHADAEVYNAMIRDLVAGASTKHATTRKLEKRGLLSRAASLRRSRPGTPT